MRLFLVVDTDTNITTIDEIANAYNKQDIPVYFATDETLLEEYSDGSSVFEIKKLKKVEMTRWGPACD